MAGNFWLSSHCNQWIWDREELDIDRREDVLKLGSIANYQKVMTLLINFIQEIGEKIPVRQQVIATATTYREVLYKWEKDRMVKMILQWEIEKMSILALSIKLGSFALS